MRTLVVLTGLLLACWTFCVGGQAIAQAPVKPCAEGVGQNGQQTCGTVIQPQASATAVESSRVFKATGPSTAVDFQVNNTSAGTLWVMLFDAAAAPTGAGAAVIGCTTAATTRPCVAKWYQVGASSTIGVTWSPGPFLSLQSGQTIVCSSTGPFTLTYSASCTFSGEAM